MFKEDKETRKYATIQIDQNIKDQLREYCRASGFVMSRFVEILFQTHVSSSKEIDK